MAALIARPTSLALTLSAGLSGWLACSFDQGGVINASDAALVSADAIVVGGRDADARRNDGNPDGQIDVSAADTGLPLTCSPKSSSPRPACQFASPADVRGRSGRCDNGTFVVDRHCFDEAPCSTASPTAGVCTVANCFACQSDRSCPAATPTCTLFFVGAPSLASCCAGNSDNGDGAFTALCQSGQSCKSGLCTQAGHCFTACVGDGDCQPSGTCRSVSVLLAGVNYPALGCVSSPQSDSPSADGPGPLADSTAPEDSAVDVGAPDAGVVAADGTPVDGTADADGAAASADAAATDAAAPADGSPTDAPAPADGDTDAAAAGI